jgi:hypothetical protein
MKIQTLWARRALVALPLVAILAVTGCWPQQGGNPGQTYGNPYETALTPAAVATLAPAFTVRDASLYAVAGPNLIVGEQHGVTTPNGEMGRADLVSYDAATGAERWRRSFPEGRIFDAAVVGSDVWAVLRVDRADGTCTGALERVRLATGAPVGSTPGVWSREPLLPFGQGVYIAPNGLTPDCSTTPSTSFEVRDRATGAVKWRGPAGRLPAVAGGYLFDQPQPDATAIRAFDADGCGAPTCSPVWTATASLPGDMMAPGNGQVYATESNLFAPALVGRDQRTGAALSRIPFPAPLPTSSIAADGTSIYTTYYDPQGTTVSAYAASACSLLGCAPRWTARLPSSPSGNLIVAGGVVYVPMQSTVHAFAAEGCGRPTCEPLRSIDVGFDAGTGRVMVAGGRLYAGDGFTSSDRDVVAYAPEGP